MRPRAMPRRRTADGRRLAGRSARSRRRRLTELFYTSASGTCRYCGQRVSTVLGTLSGMESGKSQGGQPGHRTVRRRIPLLDRMEHEPTAPMPVTSGLSLYRRLCHPHARQITTEVGRILSLTNGGEQLMAAIGTRGRLRILLGSGPVVSTTCAMLREAHRRAARGTDVVVPSAPVQGRPPAALLAGLELMPSANVPFRG